MRAVAIHAARDLRVDEVPDVEPCDGQVRVRMRYAGICGSDLHYLADGRVNAFTIREPLTPGHEVVGVVETDPSGRFAEGLPVAVQPAVFGDPADGNAAHRHLWPVSFLGSASTDPHTQGGMSEFLTVTTDQVLPLPEGLPLERGVLAEPFGVALHAITVAGGVDGKRVLVVGAGPIGLLAAAGAHLSGAARVDLSDVRAEPLRRGAALGVDRTIQVGSDEVPTEAYDVVLDCTGAPAAVTADLAAVARGGVVVIVGMLPDAPIEVNLAKLITTESQIRGTFRSNDEMGRAIELLAAHPELGDVVSDIVGVAAVDDAFALAADPAASAKVVVELW